MRNIDAVRGFKDLFVSAVNGGTTVVEEIHTAIARRPFEALELDPATGVPAAAVRTLHDTIAGGIYWGLRSMMELAGNAADWALTPLEQNRPAEEEPLPAALDLAISALNGIMGDHLERNRNALRTRMEFRHQGRAIALDAETLRRTYPGAGRKLAVFVHGLACNEQAWRLYAEETYGDRDTTYGSLLQQELGYTPLYLRYNSGLHVSENGALLAAEMEELVNAWSVPVDEIVLIGHSMGGLVARSACHQGKQGRNGWIDSVRHIFCLGTPHLGAPLEKLGNLMGWALNISDLTRPIANIVNGRSDGIKDLRFGYLVEEDWRGRDADALLEDNRHDIPFLDSAAHYLIAATVTENPSDPLGFILGDTLVRFPSASGHGVQATGHVSFRAVNKSHLGMTTHLRLLNHRAVYDQIRFWLEPASGALTTLADTE